MTPKPATQQQPAPSAYAGDEVYFTKNGQPVAGKVVCSGKHGCTVAHEGKHHKVKYEHILGHKKRAVQRYHVHDQGEDGMIVRDSTGKHHFVSIPPESKSEQLQLAKAHVVR